MTITEDAPIGHFNRWEVLRWHLEHHVAPVSTSVTLAEYRDWKPARRRHFDDGRIDRIAGSVVVKTPQLQKLSLEYRHAAVFARRAIGRTGILLSGPATMGKTTAAMHIMREAFQRHVDRHPEWRALGHVPLVYVEIPSKCTAKDLMGRVLEFFDLPAHPRMTLEERTRVATTQLVRSRASLVVFDEIHNLSEIGQTQFESAQAIKNLMNAVPAVPLYVGLDLERKAITNNTLGAQFAARSTLVRLGRYEIDTDAGVKLWNGLIVAFEKQLGLLNHPPQTLLPLSTHLWTLTRGSIGALSRLLNLAAITLITAEEPEAETITQELLDSIQLDLTSERELELAGAVLPTPKKRRRNSAA
jgi:hypothetical protein